MHAETSPIAHLSRWAERARQGAHPLPKLQAESRLWSGIGFRLGEADLLAPLGVAVEVSVLPPVIPVPRAKPWLVGVANVRGGLLPVVDLQNFLNNRMTGELDGGWVITFRTGEVTTGVLVHGVMGLRHFRADEEGAAPECPDATLATYLRSGFQDSERHWGVFDFDRLAQNREFLHVGWMMDDRPSASAYRAGGNRVEGGAQ